tara:strand:- start:30 stop:293 length:264 start_codon:yes stop_codon:yes gene_type:complete
MTGHNYTNPSQAQDLSHLEAGVHDDEELDAHGFTKRKKISDRECIYKCLCNCEQLAGLDKNQVQRLIKQFEVMSDDIEDVQSEYPPL